MNSTNKLLDDANFVSWVLEDMPEHVIWSKFKIGFPDQANNFDAAVKIIKLQQDKKQNLSKEDIADIWTVLEEEFDNKRSFRFWRKLVK